MAEKKWKQWERDVASLIGGQRKPANSGAEIDAEGPSIVAQCKHLRRLGLGELMALAGVIAEQGAAKGKLGIVALRLKLGSASGRRSPEIVVMTTEQFKKMLGPDFAKWQHERLMMETHPPMILETREVRKHLI